MIRSIKIEIQVFIQNKLTTLEISKKYARHFLILIKYPLVLSCIPEATASRTQENLTDIYLVLVHMKQTIQVILILRIYKNIPAIYDMLIS